MSRSEENREVEMTVSSDWMTQVDQRLTTLEDSVKRVESNTTNVVEAFNAAAGAFKVLEWLGKLAKPVLWITGVATVGTAVIKNAAHSQNSVLRSITELFK